MSFGITLLILYLKYTHVFPSMLTMLLPRAKNHLTKMATSVMRSPFSLVMVVNETPKTLQAIAIGILKNQMY